MSKQRLRDRLWNLGLDNYRDYLSSEHWMYIKDKYFAKHKRVCFVCKSDEKICLHHITYDRLGDEIDSDLIPLCEKCHNEVHKRVRKQLLLLEGAHFTMRKLYKRKKKK